MTFRAHLNEKLKNPEFKKAYEEEKRLLELGLAIARQQHGMTQKELAQKSCITQQQLSKMGACLKNCDMHIY